MVWSTIRPFSPNTGSVKMLNNKQKNVINEGSRTWEFANAGIIAAGASETVRVSEEFPRSKLFDPLDSIEVINNSAMPVSLRLNSPTEVYTIPSYMVKPIANKPFRQFSLTNAGAVNIAAGEVIVHVKRLAGSVTITRQAEGATR